MYFRFISGIAGQLLSGYYERVSQNLPPRKEGKRRGNPNWGKPQPLSFAPPTISSFELLVKALKLAPHQYQASQPLKEWVRANRNHKYVPQELLQAWGFEVISEV
jgi:hypothetical protein